MHAVRTKLWGKIVEVGVDPLRASVIYYCGVVCVYLGKFTIRTNWKAGTRERWTDVEGWAGAGVLCGKVLCRSWAVIWCCEWMRPESRPSTNFKWVLLGRIQ